MADDKPKRVKEISEHNQKILSGVGEDLRGFYTELQSKYDIDLYLTSGKRESKGRHGTGEALDFRSRGYEYLYSDLMNTEWGLGLMTKYGVGILDETDPEILKKTGGDAAHFHIGKDSTIAPVARQRYQDFQAGKEINEVVAYAAKPYTQQGGTFSQQNNGSTQPLPELNIPTIDANEAVRSYRSYQAIEAGLREEKETQDKTAEKEQNAAIKNLQEKQKQRSLFLEEISKVNSFVEQKRAPQQQDGQLMEEQQIDIQQQMPQLFKIQ